MSWPISPDPIDRRKDAIQKRPKLSRKVEKAEELQEKRLIDMAQDNKNFENGKKKRKQDSFNGTFANIQRQARKKMEELETIDRRKGHRDVKEIASQMSQNVGKRGKIKIHGEEEQER